jgi:ribosomal protein L25 (general stress protein Ctc)
MSGVQSGVNMFNQRERDKKERKWNKEDYAQERADAIADFERVNAYNHPQQQMIRLKQAGLNPNLVYGKGADNTSAMVRSSNLNKSTPTAYQIPETPPIQVAQGFMDMKLKQAQTDNLGIQAELMQKEALLKDVNATKVLQETATNKFQLEQAQSLKDIVVEQAKLNVENTKATTAGTQQSTLLTAAKIQETAQNMQLAVRADERAKLANAANVASTLQQIAQRKLEMAKNPDEIALLKQTIDNAKQDNIVKQAQAQLAKEGTSPSDPWYFRNMVTLMAKIRDGIKNATK